MSDDFRPDKRLWCGASGTGKTTAAVKAFLEEDAKWKLVYDPEGQISQRKDFPLCQPVGDAGLDDAIERGGIICYDPCIDGWQDYTTGTPAKPGPLEYFCGYVLKMKDAGIKGRRLVLIDELNIRCRNNGWPINVISLWQTGRHYETDVFACAAVPSGIHGAVWPHFTEVTTFRQANDRSMQLLAEWGITREEQLALGAHGWWRKNAQSGKITTSKDKAT